MADPPRPYHPRPAEQRSPLAPHWLRALFYRLSGGRLGGHIDAMPALLLTTRSSTTEHRHAVLLPYLADGDDFIVLLPLPRAVRPPAWYLDLAIYPTARVQVGRRRLAVVALPLPPSEREQVQARLAREHPRFGRAQSVLVHDLTLLRLHPVP
jgi:deazaflavin-dependent oxidoreductase (nitroreductase family)